jgi:hypothetical protein
MWSEHKTESVAEGRQLQPAFSHMTTLIVAFIDTVIIMITGIISTIADQWSQRCLSLGNGTVATFLRQQVYIQ